MSPEPQETTTAWRAALDELEATLVDPERPWQPPEDLGPLPPSELARAERLLNAQQRRMAELRAEARSTRETLGSLRAPRAEDAPAIYLDRLD